jgi:hypothetical protein
MVDSTDSGNNSSKDLGAVFDEHVRHEFEDHDVEATMKTMVREPYVHHVPTLTGGIGYNGVYNFYKNHFIGKHPVIQILYMYHELLVKIRSSMSLL